MKPYSNILVAIDITDEADQVLARAVSLTARCEAEIAVLHVAQPRTYYGDSLFVPSPVDSDLLDENEFRKALFQELDKRVDKAGIERGCVDIRLGRPVVEILAKAKSDGAGLIVVGSHGRHGLQLLLGSTANGVLHRAPCDVLAVRIVE